MLHIEVIFFLKSNKNQNTKLFKSSKTFCDTFSEVVSLWYWGYDTLSEGCIKPLGKTLHKS